MPTLELREREVEREKEREREVHREGDGERIPRKIRNGSMEVAQTVYFPVTQRNVTKALFWSSSHLLSRQSVCICPLPSWYTAAYSTRDL